jgi:hypothetical protein
MKWTIRGDRARWAGLVAGWLLVCFAGLAPGADVQLDVTSPQPLVGDTVEVALRVTNAPACATWSLLLRFDPAKLEFTGQWEGAEKAFVADSRAISQINATGQARLGGYGLSDAVRTGTLARLWFRAVATGVTEVATADRVEMRTFGNAMYTLAGVETRPTTPQPVAITIASNADNDGDGMPDAWEIRNFGGTSAAKGGAAEDWDGDGMSNLKEWLTGTSPTDAQSCLMFRAIAGEAGGLGLDFDTVGGLLYNVYWKTNLTGAADWACFTNFLGTGGPSHVLVPNALPQGFFQIRVSP